MDNPRTGAGKRSAMRLKRRLDTRASEFPIKLQTRWKTPLNIAVIRPAVREDPLEICPGRSERTIAMPRIAENPSTREFEARHVDNLDPATRIAAQLSTYANSIRAMDADGVHEFRAMSLSRYGSCLTAPNARTTGTPG